MCCIVAVGLFVAAAVGGPSGENGSKPPSKSDRSPTVSITTPATGARYRAPANIPIDVAVAAPAGVRIEKVEFFQGQTKLGEDAVAPYSFTWVKAPGGSYGLTAVARHRSLPVEDALVLSSTTADALALGYNNILTKDGKYYMYYVVEGKIWRCELVNDGKTAANPVEVKGECGSVIEKDGVYYTNYHHWVQGVCKYDIGKSSDGLTFTADPRNPLFDAGEDMADIIHNNQFYCYIRPRTHPHPRAIALMKSKDFVNWSPMKDVLVPDWQDYRKEFYCMPVIKIGNEFFGFVSTLRIGNNGEDTEQQNPTGDEQTVEVQLTHSPDGEKWTRLLNREPFIARGKYCQVHVMATCVTARDVWLYCAASERRHTDLEDKTADTTRKYFSTVRYSISIADLLSLKDESGAMTTSSAVNITVR